MIVSPAVEPWIVGVPVMLGFGLFGLVALGFVAVVRRR